MDDFGSPAVPTENDIVLVKIKGQVFKFLASKNQTLEDKYGFDFASVISRFAVNDIVNTIEANQQRHPHHKIAVIVMPLGVEPYLYEVPFLAEPSNIIFLKTFYPSRKMMRKCWDVPRKSKRLKKRLRKNAASNIAISVETTSIITLSIHKES